jgi:hypothetical protein
MVDPTKKNNPKKEDLGGGEAQGIADPKKLVCIISVS